MGRNEGANEISDESSDEGCNEGCDEEENANESDEGDEDEGQEGEQGCRWKEGQERRLRGSEGEDFWRFVQGQLDAEQVWQDRVEGCVAAGQEELQEQRVEEVVRCGQAGAQGDGHQGFLPGWRKDGPGQGAVCKGQGNRGQEVRKPCAHVANVHVT